jgi:hypothetical protein
LAAIVDVGRLLRNAEDAEKVGDRIGLFAKSRRGAKENGTLKGNAIRQVGG